MNFEQMKAVYEMVKAIYNKEERLVIGKEKLHLTHGINKNSFADFYRAFQKMLDGELHTRGISTDLRDFYLSQIYEDYGTKKLETALNAYMDFIIYYEKKHNNIKKKYKMNFHDLYDRLYLLTASKKACMLLSGVCGGISHPDDITKFLYFLVSLSNAVVALYTASGVACLNMPTGSRFPITNTSDGHSSRASCISMALPK